MIKLTYLLYLFSFQLGSLNVQSLLSFPRGHTAMTSSRVYTMRSRIEEWYSQIKLAAIQTEETQGQFAINYKELLPMEYAVYLVDSGWDALPDQRTFDSFVRFGLSIPENERNISVVWKFLKIPTVDWYIGYSHLKSLAMQHNTSPIIGPWLKSRLLDSNIASAVKRLKSLPSSVISKETFDEFVSNTMKIPPEEQDSRVWMFLLSLHLHYKFCELYILLKMAAYRDEGFSIDIFRDQFGGFGHLHSLRNINTKENCNWGYLSISNITQNDLVDEARWLRHLADQFSLSKLSNDADEFNELVSKYIHPADQDFRVLPYAQKIFNSFHTISSSSSTISSTNNGLIASAYKWYSQIKAAAVQTQNVPVVAIGNYKELLKGPKGFPSPTTENEMAFNEFVTSLLKIPRSEQDNRVWGFIQKQVYVVNRDWYFNVKLAVIQIDSIPTTDLSTFKELFKGPNGKNPPIKTEAAFDSYVSNTLQIPPNEQDSRVWGFLQKLLKFKNKKLITPLTLNDPTTRDLASYKWYDEVKMAIAQTEKVPADIGNYKELLIGPKGFAPPMRNEKDFNIFVSNTLKIPRNEQDSRVWGFIQNLHKAKKPILQGSNMVATTSIPTTTVVVTTSPSASTPLKPSPVPPTKGGLVASSPPQTGTVKLTTLVSSLDDIKTFKVLMKSIAPREVSCDFEGENLGKFGKISLVSIGVAPPSSSSSSMAGDGDGDVRVFVFDLLHRNPALKQAATDLIKKIMEDRTVLKIIHDCRTDRAALYYTMKPRIDLTSVFDTSVWDVELRLLDKLVGDANRRQTLNCWKICYANV